METRSSNAALRASKPGNGSYIQGMICLGCGVAAIIFGFIIAPSMHFTSSPGDFIGLFALLLIPIGLFALEIYFIRKAKAEGYGIVCDPEVVLKDIRSADRNIRRGAARLLFLIEDLKGLEASQTCLQDDDAVVRYHALRALLSTDAGKRVLSDLFLSENADDVATTRIILSDVAAAKMKKVPVDGPTRSLVEEKFKVLLESAIRYSKKVETSLPLIEARQNFLRTIPLECPIPGESQAVTVALRMPTRCCSCGTQNPQKRMALSAEYSHSTSGPSGGRIVMVTTTRNYRLSVPLCNDCLSEIEEAQADERRMRAQRRFNSVIIMDKPCMVGEEKSVVVAFDDPHFIAEFLLMNEEVMIKA